MTDVHVGSEQPEAWEDHAVVIGIGHYKSLDRLDKVESDAEGFYSWLLSPEGGHLPIENVDFQIAGSLSPGEPTLSTLQEGVFERVLKLALDRDGMRVGRRLYVYLAGHGIDLPHRRPALLTANAGGFTGYTAAHFSAMACVEWFSETQAFDEIVLFTDTCRTSQPHLLEVPLWDRVIGRRNYPSLLYLGHATVTSQSAFEPVGEGRGRFTEALLEGLSGRARDHKGRVTGASLAQYVHKRVGVLSLNRSWQEPDINAGRSITFLSNVSASATATRVLFTGAVPEVELIGPEYKDRRNLGAVPGELLLELQMGRYLARVPSTLVEQHFTVIGEDTIHVQL